MVESDLLQKGNTFVSSIPSGNVTKVISFKDSNALLNECWMCTVGGIMCSDGL